MKLKFIVVLISISSLLYSQSDFRKGFYITNLGDTVFGLINYKGDIVNSKTCSFKKDLSSKSIDFQPNEIYAYRFTDSKYYITKKVTINKNEKLLFLECLINGRVIIYYLKEEENRERYFIEKDGKLYELENDEIHTYDTYGNEFVRNTKHYIGMLKTNFSDCPSIFHSVDNASLTKESLIKLSKDYHQMVCKDKSCIIYEKKEIKVNYDFGIFCKYGLDFDDFNYSSLNYYTQNVDFKSLKSYGLGFLVQANLPEWNEKLFYKLSLSINQLNYRSKIEYFKARVGYDTISWSKSKTNLDVELSVLYLIPINKNKIFTQFGLSSFLVNMDDQTIFYNGKNHYYTNFDKDILRLELGLNWVKELNNRASIMLGVEFVYHFPWIDSNYYGYWFTTGILIK